MAEHLCHIEVEGALAVALYKREVCVASGFAHHIHRGALALGNLTHVFDVLLLYEQAHALLALVGNDFLGRECGVANGQLGHVDLSTALLNQLAQAVNVACRTVVVDRYYGVDVLLAQGAHQVVGTLLHFGVGALHGVEFDAAAVTAGVDRAY